MKQKKTSETGTPPQYPWLVNRHKHSTVIERRVRRFLNRQTPEGDEEARKLLSAIPPEKRGEEYYFLSGCLRHRMGHTTDAMAYLDRACELAQGKISEYEKVRATLQSEAEPTPEDMENFMTFDDDGQMYQPHRAFVFWNFVGECCVEGCFECACEGCTSGCAEGCCEAGCDGCSCDC